MVRAVVRGAWRVAAWAPLDAANVLDISLVILCDRSKPHTLSDPGLPVGRALGVEADEGGLPAGGTLATDREAGSLRVV